LRSGVSFNDPHHWQLSQPSGNYPTAADRSQAGRIHGQFADLDDARRGIRGAQTATPESSPTTTVAPGSTPRTDISPDATGSEYLRQERAWAKKELDEDPQLMRFVRGVIAHEQSPGERSKVFESMLNRINALRANGQPNLSIREYLSRRGSAQFYGPIRRGEITERFLRSVIDPYPDDVDRDINRVLRGSNEVLGFTDQGSRNDPNFARERASGEFVYSHGELYGDHNAAARNYRIQQQRAVAGYRDAVREAQTSRGPTPRGPHVDIGMIQEANRALPTLGPTGGFRPSTVGGDDPVTADINQALDKLSKENK